MRPVPKLFGKAVRLPLPNGVKIDITDDLDEALDILRFGLDDEDGDEPVGPYMTREQAALYEFGAKVFAVAGDTGLAGVLSFFAQHCGRDVAEEVAELWSTLGQIDDEDEYE